MGIAERDGRGGGLLGNVSFVDFFSLCRVDGTWKIVNKTFVHVGGEAPA